MTSPLIDALRRAVAAAPDDVALRLHLADVLLGAGFQHDAVVEVAAALQREPTNTEAILMMGRALPSPPPSPGDPEPIPVAEPTTVADPAAVHHTQPAGSTPTIDAEPLDPVTYRPPAKPEPGKGFDWSAAEQDFGHVAEPMFTDESAAPPPPVDAFDVQRPALTLADVGGMTAVKERLEASFFAPLRNPELRRLYGKNLRGGLLLYGPPGCGKTFLARAVAGELGANFVSIGLSDVLDPYIGVSERNVHEAFQLARREAPCVLFLDEIDSLGQRRTGTHSGSLRNTVNQLLTELDGIGATNDGVFILAATNQPWDVDPALRRPGRLDRTLLVLPPDLDARSAIFRFHLKDRPIEGIDLAALAKASDGLSGADIAYVCELGVERALLDSVRTGQPRLIGMRDLLGALTEVRPSTSGWLDSARNVVMFGDDDGTYRELREYLKRIKRL